MLGVMSSEWFCPVRRDDLRPLGFSWGVLWGSGRARMVHVVSLLLVAMCGAKQSRLGETLGPGHRVGTRWDCLERHLKQVR